MIPKPYDFEPISVGDHIRKRRLELGLMQKELQKARKTLEEHREQIDAYLKKTDGGKPFGGRNGQN